MIQKRFLRFLLVDSFAMVLLAAFTVLIAVESFLLSYTGWFVTWSMIWFFQNMISTVQINAFSVPLKTRARASSSAVLMLSPRLVH
jgi:hypothetical protein